MVLIALLSSRMLDVVRPSVFRIRPEVGPAMIALIEASSWEDRHPLSSRALPISSACVHLAHIPTNKFFARIIEKLRFGIREIPFLTRQEHFQVVDSGTKTLVANKQ